MRPQDRPDYIEHGSPEHAALLGLEPDPGSELGYRLADPTMFGASASPEFLRRVLEQKINELNTPPEYPQDADRFAPNFAPPMWTPPDERADY